MAGFGVDSYKAPVLTARGVYAGAGQVAREMRVGGTDGVICVDAERMMEI